MSDLCSFLRDHPKCSYIKSWHLDSDSLGERALTVSLELN